MHIRQELGTAEFNGKEMSQELMKEAMGCETAEELLALAEKNGISITAEEAQAYLDEFDGAELSMDELSQVAGSLQFCYSIAGCSPKSKSTD